MPPGSVNLSRPMANVFPQWANQLPWKFALGAVALGAALVAAVGYYATPKYTRVGYEPSQPVPFSHALHAGQLGMDCRFCHSFVEVAGQANLPTAQTCMSCHQQIKADSPQLAAVRAAWNGGKGDGPPIQWTRVHRLPDYVYFNHAAHVSRGVSCLSCHGDVSEMAVVYQKQPQSMKWCLDCHRVPEDHLRPPSAIFSGTAWPGPSRTGIELKQAWGVSPSVTCGACHR